MELENNVKQIKINLDAKSKKMFLDKSEKDKEKKMRIETKTWGLNEDDLEHKKQLDTINIIISNLELDKHTEDVSHSEDKSFKKYKTKMLAHIKSKIQSYKQQDIIKKRINNEEFVSLNEVLRLLQICNLKCHYCSENVFILYEIVRESKQWSLDRINNDIGHNENNLLISCLECNLKRRRTNKDAFYFTKNLVIMREGIDN
jgi:hypothetical protein